MSAQIIAIFGENADLLGALSYCDKDRPRYDLDSELNEGILRHP